MDRKDGECVNHQVSVQLQFLSIVTKHKLLIRLPWLLSVIIFKYVITLATRDSGEEIKYTLWKKLGQDLLSSKQSYLKVRLLSNKGGLCWWSYVRQGVFFSIATEKSSRIPKSAQPQSMNVFIDFKSIFAYI